MASGHANGGGIKARLDVGDKKQTELIRKASKALLKQVQLSSMCHNTIKLFMP